LRPAWVLSKINASSGANATSPLELNATKPLLIRLFLQNETYTDFLGANSSITCRAFDLPIIYAVVAGERQHPYKFLIDAKNFRNGEYFEGNGTGFISIPQGIVTLDFTIPTTGRCRLDLMASSWMFRAIRFSITVPPRSFLRISSGWCSSCSSG
jgi:hypothetical protein